MAQALATECTPALAPSSRPTQAAGPFGISIGTVCGETRRGPGRLQDVVLGEQGLRAADAGADADGEPLRVEAGVGQAGVGPGLLRGDQRDRLGAVQPAQLDPVEHLGRLDGQLGGDPDRQLLGPLLGERTHPGAAGEHGVPGRRDVPAERGRRAEPGDDDVGRVTHDQDCRLDVA